MNVLEQTTTSSAEDGRKHRTVRVGAAVPPTATNFDQLPDSALVSVKVAAVVMGRGVSTLWAKAKSDPRWPQFRKYGAKHTATTVGEIRRFQAMAARDAAQQVTT